MLNNFRLGTLFDFVCTEPDLINHKELYFTGHDGEKEYFTRQELNNCLGWFEKLKKHPLLKVIIANSDSQKEVFNDDFQVTHEGQTFKVKVKGKFDLYTSLSYAGDLKFVSAKSQRQFESMVQMFNYDRQGAFYMDMDDGGVETFLIIGVPKLLDYRKHEAFIVVMKKGDELYNSGKAKYQKGCYDYWSLIDSF